MPIDKDHHDNDSVYKGGLASRDVSVSRGMSEGEQALGTLLHTQVHRRSALGGGCGTGTEGRFVTFAIALCVSMTNAVGDSVPIDSRLAYWYDGAYWRFFPEDAFRNRTSQWEETPSGVSWDPKSKKLLPQ